MAQSGSGSKSSAAPNSAQAHRVLDILEALARWRRPQSLAQIVDQVGVPKASAYRLLSVLTSRGYVHQDPVSGGYGLGVRCFEIGNMWANSIDLLTAARPHLVQLNLASQETVHLAVYDEGDAVYVEKIESPQPVRAVSAVGGRSPGFCVATGRALLAHQPTGEIRRVLEGELSRFTENTVTDPLELQNMLAAVRVAGVAINRGSFREGVCGVAVPVRDHTGTVVASVGICLPQHRFGPDAEPVLTRETMLAAQAISKELGFVGTLVGLEPDDSR